MSIDRDTRTNQESGQNQTAAAQHKPEQGQPAKQSQAGQQTQPGQRKNQPGGYPQARRDDQSHDQKQDGPGRTDEELVGQDTDGDGKVVKPGHAPGQSHGKGLRDK